MVSKREPVGNTCPMIDSVISGIRSAMKDINLIDDKLSIVDIFDTRDIVIENLDNLESILEKIRSANHQLRGWGVDLVEEIDEIEKDHYRAIEDIDYEMRELKSKLSSREDRIFELENLISEYEDKINFYEQELNQLK